MASYNRVTLMGNMTRDVELRHTNAGSAVAEVGLAINRFWTDRKTNQRREESTFIDITFWPSTVGRAP